MTTDSSETGFGPPETPASVSKYQPTEGVWRPSGAAERDAACGGRCGGGFASPTSKETQSQSDSCSGSESYVFPELAMEGPVAALEATVEHKIRTYTSLGERDTIEQLRKALSVARARLLEALAAPRIPVGS